MIFNPEINRINFFENPNGENWDLLLKTLNWHPGQEFAGRATDMVPDIKSAEETSIQPEVHRHVKRALERTSTIDSTYIVVQVKGNMIVLGGRVKSWLQKEEAGRVAKYGNFIVINEIAISYY